MMNSSAATSSGEIKKRSGAQCCWRNFFFLLLLVSVFFGLSIGFQILPLGSCDWLKVKEDPSNHFLGWLFFQASDWQWPLGHTSLLLAPTGASIATTDSIPLFGYLFKIFRNLLPYPSQYFGLALFVSYLGLGLTSFQFLRKRTEASYIALLIATGVILCSPAFFNRLSSETPHIALTFHCLLIGALAVWTVKEEFQVQWRTVFLFNFVLALASVIHPFLWIMLASIHVPMTILFSVRQSRWMQLLGVIIFGLGLPIFLLKMGGVLGGPGELGTFGFGIFSANLLTFIDPNQFSRWLPDLISNPGQSEGMAYLGLGILCLLFFQIFHGLRRFFHTRQLKVRFSPTLLVWVWALFLALFSFSQKVYFADQLIVDLSVIYDHLSLLTGPLRSSGRLIWPLYYLITLTALMACLKYPKRWSIIGLSLVLILQFGDTFPFDRSPLQSWTHLQTRQFFSDQDLSDIELIRFFPPVAAWERNVSECFVGVPIEYADYLQLAISAGARKIALNSGMASRFPWQALEKECVETKRILLGLEKESQKTLYVFNSTLQIPGNFLDCSVRGPTKLCRIKKSAP